MKVEIRSVHLKTTYVGNGPDKVDDPSLRVVECIERRPDGTIANQELKFVLPAIEVDHQIVVGGVYELVFARRES